MVLMNFGGRIADVGTPLRYKVADAISDTAEKVANPARRAGRNLLFLVMGGEDSRATRTVDLFLLGCNAVGGVMFTEAAGSHRQPAAVLATSEVPLVQQPTSLPLPGQ